MALFTRPPSEGFPGANQYLPSFSGSASTSRLPPFPSRSALKAGTQLFRPVGYTFDIRIQGLNVAAQHWDAVQELIPYYMWIVQDRAGELIRDDARAGLRGETGFKPAYISGDTHDSVHHYITTTPNSVMASIGPTTFYAPFIEYGMASHSGIGPRPFMMQAAFKNIPELIQAYSDLALLAKLGARAPLTAPNYKPPLSALIHKWRAWLYDKEKALGDITPLGPVGISAPGMSVFRSQLIGSARLLGDLNAFITKTVNARFKRRLVGKLSGRAIGLGHRAIFVNQQVSVGFTPAQRGYNLLAGKAVTKYVDQNRTLAGWLGK